MLALLIVLGGFVPLLDAASVAELQPSLLTTNNGVITGQYLDSLMLSLPPCEYAGQNVHLEYTNTITNDTMYINDAFMVPTCDNITCLDNPLSVNRGLGYQLSGLNDSTLYSVRYMIGSNKTVPVAASTIKMADYNTISEKLPGRSAAMIVITVLLSVAMFLLLVGLLVTVFMPR
ncbi:uroplakin-2-like [Trichomycterus rosablanca]|uniref:uroplakin-2-like n=1 Tax=Trichomycterus rosablanca TaxID=2290929 RepID=UPI002F359AEE